MVGIPGQALSAAHPGPDPPASSAKADQVAGGTPVSCLAIAGAARRPVAGSSAATAARQSDGDCGQAQPSSWRISAVTSIHAGQSWSRPSKSASVARQSASSKSDLRGL